MKLIRDAVKFMNNVAIIIIALSSYMGIYSHQVYIEIYAHNATISIKGLNQFDLL